MGKKIVIFTWIVALILIPYGFYRLFSPYPIPSYTSWVYGYPEGSNIGVAAISDNGQFIVAGDNSENDVYLFNTSSKTPLWTYDGAIYEINLVDISSNGDHLVAGSGDRIYYFNRTSSTPIWNFQATSIVDSIAISKDGKYVAVGSNNTIYLLNSSAGTPKLPIWQNSMNFQSFGDPNSMIVSISDNGNYILTAHRGNHTLRLFNVLSPNPLMTIHYELGGAGINRIHSIAMSSDGNFFMVSMQNKIVLYNNTSTTPEWEYTHLTWSSGDVTISDDGNYIAATFHNGDFNVFFFHRTSSTPLWWDSLNPYADNGDYNDYNTKPLALSSNGNALVVGSHDDVYYYGDTSIDTPTIYRGDQWVDISADGKYFISSKEELIFYDSENPEFLPEGVQYGPSENPLFALNMSLITGPLFLALFITIISVIKGKKKKRRPISIRAPKEIVPIPIDREMIFISYATVDSALFQIPRLTKTLISYPEIDEVLYWESDMHDDIYQYMDDNLKLAKIVLLFCSKNSQYSEAVKMEWRAALKLDKKIIPIFIEPDDIPTLLTTKLGVQFDEEDPYTSIEKIYQMILQKLEIESFRDYTKYLMLKKINEKEFDIRNPESIEKSVILDSDLPSHELADELTYILQDSNFSIPGKQLKAKKKKKSEIQEVSEEEFIKFNSFAELKDDKEDIGLYITIQRVSDKASKIFLKAKGQREWVLNEILNSLNLKCMDLKDINEIIRSYSEKVQSLIDKIQEVDKFLRKYLGSEYKKIDKLVGQYKNNEIGKEELIIKGSQLVGKEFITVFIKNIPAIIQASKKSG
ncbi:MAG: TIR domain-containing protein [Promethearchaeota archaeon]